VVASSGLSNKPLLLTPKKWVKRYALVIGLAAQQNDETLGSPFDLPGVTELG
jgi:hypothetical protein